MDFSRSLWDITFLKVNTTTLTAPDQGPNISSPAFRDTAKCSEDNREPGFKGDGWGRASLCRKVRDDLGRHVTSYSVLPLFRPNCTKPQDHCLPYDRRHRPQSLWVRSASRGCHAWCLRLGNVLQEDPHPTRATEGGPQWPFWVSSSLGSWGGGGRWLGHVCVNWRPTRTIISNEME